MQRVRALPPGRRVSVVVAVLGGSTALAVALVVVVQLQLGDGSVDWSTVMVPALGPVVGWVSGWSLPRWQQRHRVRAGERQRMRPFWTATRTGRLPAEADAGEWLPLLARVQARHRRRMVLLAAGAAALGVVLLGGVVLATALGRLDVRVYSILTSAVVYAQFTLLGWGLGAAKQRRLAGLRERLASREATAEPVH
ncbi:hypothetical protein ACJTNH_07520 [Modestobacter lacusdianchii]